MTCLEQDGPNLRQLASHRIASLGGELFFLNVPQLHGMHPGFAGPLTPLVILEVDEVDEGGILEGVFLRFRERGRNESCLEVR
jgi:hypothetical protein